MEDAKPLSVRDLRFRYRSGEWTLEVARLDIEPAQQLLLTGGSGRGKSTLLHLIAGLEEPQGGEVLVAGRNIHAMFGAKRDLYRGRHIGMVFQTFNLLHGFSAVENVMAALMFSDIPRKEHRSRALGLLEQLEIERWSATPDQLSIGQQQRVAVARALVCDPEVVLADEPTASLDPDNAQTAMMLMQDACRERGAALLCVSHDVSMEARFEHRITLDSLTEAR